MGSKTAGQMSKEDIKRVSIIHEKEKLKIEKEEQGLSDDDLDLEKSYSNAEGDFSLNFFNKTDDQIRRSYIDKLINMKILKLEPAKKHQSSKSLPISSISIEYHHIFLSSFASVSIFA